ncbi:hypothetical protein GCM10027589_31430 [Actinocorallia lasiicapitis]
MTSEPRTPEQRRTDTLALLADEADLWLATASPDGEPCLVPLSYRWDGETVLICTLPTNPTGRNLLASGRAKATFGRTRDVVLMDVTAEPIAPADLPAADGDAFAVRADWDPRLEPQPYTYFRLRPRRLQAWREANEIKGRTLLSDGAWL